MENSELARADRVIEAIRERPFFLFPLQLSNDFQIREHSPFQDMAEGVQYVLSSFARRAPEDVMLLVKEHPLDASLTNWRRHVDALAHRLGIGDRVVHIRGGNLTDLAAAARGLVTVNSTSSTLSLASGVPTMALGKAIYNMAGITHQGRLDDFWVRPQAPDAAVFDAFRRVLYDRCLIYGGLASESATRTLVESALERLVGDRVSHWRPALVAARG
jgi:capsular polysaccharide export protein